MIAEVTVTLELQHAAYLDSEIMIQHALELQAWLATCPRLKDVQTVSYDTRCKPVHFNTHFQGSVKVVATAEATPICHACRGHRGDLKGGIWIHCSECPEGRDASLANSLAQARM